MASNFKKIQELNESLAASLQESARNGNLDSVSFKIADMLRNVRFQHPDRRLGFVAGIIESDGLKFRYPNLEKLFHYTKMLGDEYPFPIFSAADIYGKEFLRRFNSVNDPDKWDRFWKHILVNGKVTDIFMTPGWNRSYGAKIEFKIATKIGITIHIIDKKSAHTMLRG